MLSFWLIKWLRESCRVIDDFVNGMLSLLVVPVYAIEVLSPPSELAILQYSVLLLSTFKVKTEPGFDFLRRANLISAVYLAGYL